MAQITPRDIKFVEPTNELINPKEKDQGLVWRPWHKEFGVYVTGHGGLTLNPDPMVTFQTKEECEKFINGLGQRTAFSPSRTVGVWTRGDCPARFLDKVPKGDEPVLVVFIPDACEGVPTDYPFDFEDYMSVTYGVPGGLLRILTSSTRRAVSRPGMRKTGITKANGVSGSFSQGSPPEPAGFAAGSPDEPTGYVVGRPPFEVGRIVGEHKFVTDAEGRGGWVQATPEEIAAKNARSTGTYPDWPKGGGVAFGETNTTIDPDKVVIGSAADLADVVEILLPSGEQGRLKREDLKPGDVVVANGRQWLLRDSQGTLEPHDGPGLPSRLPDARRPVQEQQPQEPGRLMVSKLPVRVWVKNADGTKRGEAREKLEPGMVVEGKNLDWLVLPGGVLVPDGPRGSTDPEAPRYIDLAVFGRPVLLMLPYSSQSEPIPVEPSALKPGDLVLGQKHVWVYGGSGKLRKSDYWGVIPGSRKPYRLTGNGRPAETGFAAGSPEEPAGFGEESSSAGVQVTLNDLPGWVEKRVMKGLLRRVHKSTLVAGDLVVGKESYWEVGTSGVLTPVTRVGGFKTVAELPAVVHVQGVGVQTWFRNLRKEALKPGDIAIKYNGAWRVLSDGVSLEEIEVPPEAPATTFIGSGGFAAGSPPEEPVAAGVS